MENVKTERVESESWTVSTVQKHTTMLLLLKKCTSHFVFCSVRLSHNKRVLRFEPNMKTEIEEYAKNRWLVGGGKRFPVVCAVFGTLFSTSEKCLMKINNN